MEKLAAAGLGRDSLRVRHVKIVVVTHMQEGSDERLHG